MNDEEMLARLAELGTAVTLLGMRELLSDGDKITFSTLKMVSDGLVEICDILVERVHESALAESMAE